MRRCLTSEASAPARGGGLARLLWLHCLRDPLSLPQFIADLKSGQPAEEALMLNYGLTYELLAAQFGASFGIPGVQP
ncbi:hypothetical protein [Candidatus Laterigemmans baculatus]|uniref:hypothetical protein n=1 Tax=Candidatus Laterigemmans baculatus TaxID=2770505 RepID=UPI0013DC8D1B|nr:hypothetical protein [Candidatus Laterigemmans baculatus]